MDALTQLIAVQQAVPVLAGMLSTAPPPVLLGVVKLLGALASTHEDGRLQVRLLAASSHDPYFEKQVLLSLPRPSLTWKRPVVPPVYPGGGCTCDRERSRPDTQLLTGLDSCSP